MRAITDPLANMLVDSVLRGEPIALPSTLHVGLFTAPPGMDGIGTEVTGAGYARAPIPRDLASWSGTQGAGTTIASSGTSASTSTNVPLTWPQPAGDWGPITHWGIFAAPSGGPALMRGAFARPVTIGAGDRAPILPADGLYLTIAPLIGPGILGAALSITRAQADGAVATADI